MQTQKLTSSKFIVITLIIVCSIFVGLFSYNSYIRNKLAESTFSTLQEIMQQQKFNFTSEISGEFIQMKALAEIITNLPNDVTALQSTLKDLVDKTNFEVISIIAPNGLGLVSTGEIHDFSDREFFNRALGGETVLTEPIMSRIIFAPIVVIATPMIKNDKIIAVLEASYRASHLDELFLSSFDGMGYAYIINKEGKILAKTQSTYSLTLTDNIYGTWKNSNFYGDESFDTTVQNIESQKSGYAKYDYKGQKRIMHYSPLGINDWVILSIVPDDVISGKANEILMRTLLLTSVLTFTILIVIFYIYKMQNLYINKLKRIAYVDELTGISNFHKFKVDAEALITSNNNINYIIDKFDVDRFKLINEIYGYNTGNEIIQLIAKSLAMVLDPKTETYARISGDEFIVLVSYNDDDDLKVKHKRFVDYVHAQSKDILNYKALFPTGRYYVPNGATNINQIYERVNFAHKMAKKSISSKFFVYDDTLKSLMLREKEIENKMEDALLSNQFVLYIQPKFRLVDEKIIGAEALVRWKEKNLDVVYPGDFIPVFEKNGFIINLDMYMFELSCIALREMMDKNICPVPISVNFSRLHLNNPSFVTELCSIADKYSISRDLLEVELTESTMFNNETVLIGVLDRLHQAGFTLSMDDFGTGYSSLGLLKNLPVDVIKIDRGFFADSIDEDRAIVVIASVMEMAHKLNIHTVAEGVETREHVELLKQLGCDVVQGYYYSKPMPVSEFIQKLI